MSEVIFLPSVSGPFIIMGREEWDKNDYDVDLCWWTDNALVEYPYMLISYGVISDRGEFGRFNWVEENKVPDDTFILTDSGGFQISTKDLEATPREAIEWQKESGDAGLIMDSPPRGRWTDDEKKDCNWDFFKKTAKETRQNIEYIQDEVEENKDFFYGVLHGRTPEEFDYWWEECIEPFDFDKIAYAPRPPGNPMSSSLGLSYLAEKDVQNVHVLGVLGYQVMPVMYYAGNSFKKLYFDASSFSTPGKYAQMYNQYLSKVDIGRTAKRNGIDHSSFFCNCPVCQFAEEHNITYDRLSKEPSILISLHNLWIQLDYQKYLRWASESREEMMRFLRKQSYDKTIRAIEFYEKSQEEGFETAYEDEFEKENLKGML